MKYELHSFEYNNILDVVLTNDISVVNSVRPMAHDPSSPPKFLVPETGTSNFGRVPCILVPVSGHKFLVTSFWYTRNLRGELGSCAIHLRPDFYLLALVNIFQLN